MPYNYSTTDVFSILQDLEARVAAQEAEGPAPQPVFFVQQPSVNPLTGTAGQTTYTATPGILSNGATPTRAWLLGGTVLATTLSYAPPASVSGNVVYQETGPGGVQSNPISVTVNAGAGQSLNALSLSPSTVTQGAATTITIVGVTAGSTVSVSSGQVPAGMTFNASARTITGTPSTTGPVNLSLTEALNGATRVSPVAVNVAAAPVVTPTLTLTGTFTYAADAAAGTNVATIGNVPAGATPTLTPNDGRMVIAGNQTNGWRVVKGMTASTAGTIAITVSATGANSANATINVTPAAAVPAQFTAVSYQPETAAYTTAMTTTPETRRRKTLDHLVASLKGPIPGSNDAPVWDAAKALPKAYIYLAGSTEDQWKTNLLTPTQKLTKVGSPTFSPNRGVSHTAVTDHYLTGVTLGDLDGVDFSYGGLAVGTASTANTVEMGAQDASSNGLTLGFKSSTTGKVGVRAMSASSGTTLTSNSDYWSGEGFTGVTIDGATARLSHHGKRIENWTRAAPTSFTGSTVELRILGGTGSTATSNKTIGCAYLVGKLTADQESWMAACIRNALESIQYGDVDWFREKQGPATVNLDVLVVGGTLPGGIAANVIKELRPSLNVGILGGIFETRIMHLGGMSRGGLTYVDSNLFSSLGVNGRYRDVISWINTEVYAGPDNNTQEGMGVDPKAYGFAMRRMLDPTRTGSATKINGRDVPVYFSRGAVSITGGVGNYVVTCGDGRLINCKYIQGAEYEGDLLKLFPEVQTITGTEAYVAGAPNSGGQENLNGYKGTSAAYLVLPKNKANNAETRISPYQVSEDPSSGLLPYVTLPDPAPVNSADPISQPLNQRYSVTNSLGRWTPFPTTPPPTWDPLAWEVNYRWYAAQPTVTLASMVNIRPGRSPVFDMNNSTPLSIDVPGSGKAYTDATAADGPGSYANRLAVRLTVRNFGKAFFHHILNSGDPRVPTGLRNELNAYTLDATQFLDPDPTLGEELHWPSTCATYVRDPVYRMVRSEVLPYSGQDANLSDGTPVRPAGRTAGHAAYWVDRHSPVRIAHNDGSGMAVWGQGEYFIASGGNNKYSPVAYDHIIGDRAWTSARGLIHPLAGNFTAVGWSQVRMEPALSHLSEFGACAIIVALEAGNIPVQDVDYAAVKALAQSGHDVSTLNLATTS